MKFTGTVKFRSSMRLDRGPPGEAEIQRLNPQRVEQIKRVTGWSSLEPGSLNLIVEDWVVDGLLQYTPTLVEDAANIQYPLEFQHIPFLRKEYYYYPSTAMVGDKQQEILVRRALNPLPGLIELFASVSLKKYFGVLAGELVTVEILGVPPKECYK